MKLLRKVIALSLMVCLLLAPLMSNAEVSDKVVKETEELQKLQREYTSFNGTISEVNSEGESLSILVENDNEEPYDKMMFFISHDATLVSDETMNLVSKDTLKKGMDVTLYYHKSTPILESYPARLGCDVLVVRESEEPTNVEVYRFDEDLLSTDNILKISPDDKTVIVDTEGNSLDIEDIKNRNAIVFYNIATLSLPAQTVPKKIIVLDEDELKTMDKVIINGAEIDLDNSIYKIEDEVVMVPLRQIAETLGYKVLWNEEERSVELTKGAHWFLVKIGEDDYNYARKKVQLGTAPELTDSKTFVPLDFVELIGAEIGLTIDGVLEIDQ
ncbi:copper amine oxidase N-terminal domain-containing protein [Schnuerera sp. xch1]|uniref:copper amine oxidase N-terminal domain-containing protein n=1 Tax=Schnuerera sp. xch1 TaxID=2874283 RepID=UPI001CBFD187|nr:copper amine oxidase N-terminal domain-containing protein [Schnuerera sp. xch1]MBZ2175147.1 copper amine oxidase N-terminal domain-containing protein [Schnuerera sp. xch1]